MMNLNNHAFGFYRGLIASLIIMGLLVSILVVNGLSQECTWEAAP